MTGFSVPTNEEFHAESVRFLSICEGHCTCPNGWHFLWSAFKASGWRRSIYFQQPLLAKMLAPTLPATRKILIAGAADAGIISVLASIFDAGTQYVAIDRCEAPLRAMQDYAQREKLSLQCQQVALQSFVPSDTFDLVFMHNTLVFMEPSEALDVLGSLRRALRPNGWLVCGMRYERDPSGPMGDPARYVASTRSMISTTYADRPDLARLVERHIDAEAATHLFRYQPEPFEALLKSAGYAIGERFTDTLTPAATLNKTPTHSDVLSEVMLLTAQTDDQALRGTPSVARNGET